MNTVVLNLEPVINLSDEQFYQLCVVNRDLSLELNATGELIIVPPVGGESGNREADLITDLNIWNRIIPITLSGEDVLPGFELRL